ncbi:MAG: uracil-DNA glycosylase [Bacteroidetes bacterium]|nr:uracil-DNA glycosylase [Bacteroidota bacterium]
MTSLFLKNITIHPDWKPFLSKEILYLIDKIESEIIKNEFTPSAEKVLRFLELPLSLVKVVILGQDPYPQPGVATGRAFEVGTLKSWNEPFRNVSLKNILRTLYKAHTGKAINYNPLKEKFDNEFPVLPPNKLFKHWEKQGVLLLNTSFTCEPGIPGSHKNLWEDFSAELLNYINSQNNSFTWFLWGNHALQATKNLEITNKIISQHPMMCYDKEDRETDFLFGKVNCFEQLINNIDWTGFSLSRNLSSTSTLF